MEENGGEDAPVEPALKKNLQDVNIRQQSYVQGCMRDLLMNVA